MRNYHYVTTGIASIGNHGREFRQEVEADDPVHAIMRTHKALLAQGLKVDDVATVVFMAEPCKAANAFRLEN